MRAKRLQDLLKNNPFIKGGPDLDFDITKVSQNSSLCEPGSLFVAASGALPTSKDGHDFIDAAIANGARAVVYEDDKASQNRVPMIKALDSKAALSHLCEEFYDRPSKKLNVIGITGTNGKTSTSFMLHSILKAAGLKSKIMGTLGIGEPDSLTPLSHTTMDPEFISKALAKMHEDGVTHVIMEVSSHALSLRRVEALSFRAVALTNITQDHLDFHGSLKAYTEAKARLFFELSKPDTAIILPASHPFSKSIDKRARFVPQLLADEDGFTLLRDEGTPLSIKLPFGGDFHIKNAKLAATIAGALGICDEHIVLGLKNIPMIPGRLQWINNRHDLRVVVDFAHTPDALENLLTSIKKSGRIILVFGCGGDRDRQKRPLMGKIASTLAQHVIVTDDNPRTEEPDKIRQEILKGMNGNIGVEEIADRRLAIKTAIKMARKNDIVVIAGKGHENYQIYQTTKTAFSDQIEAERALEELSCVAP